MTRETVRFKDRVVIVTGGARGIGQTIAKAFARAGGIVAIPDILEGEGKNTVKEIEAEGGQAVAMKVDATDREQVKQFVEKIASDFGKIDILVNNIGFVKTIPFLETDETFWQQSIELNLTVGLRFCHLVLPHMVEQQYGRVVNISSIAGRNPRPMAVLYSVTKAGVIAMTRSLAVAMAPYNIRINCVAPATIETPITKENRQKDPKFDEFLEELTKSIVLKRWGRPEEVADVVLFLASDESTYMVGQTLSVDGGSCML